METVAQEYIIHPTETPGHVIHEYPNGRRVLIEIDAATGKEHFVREL